MKLILYDLRADDKENKITQINKKFLPLNFSVKILVFILDHIIWESQH